MGNRQRLERIFMQIAEGFNLTEGEIEKILKLSTPKLESVLHDCFRQIEKPRDKFSEEDYEYLTEIVGCTNLEEQLENEPMTGFRTATQSIVAKIFDMPIKFTEDDLLTAVYLDGYDSRGTVAYTLDLLSHPKVKYLIKDGEYYSLNLSAKVV